MTDMPEWVESYAQECRDLFGLGEWKIHIEQHDCPGYSTETDGSVRLETRYLTATITIRRGLTVERGRVVIMHEMLHIVLAHLARSVQNLIEKLLPDEVQSYATTQYEDAEEQTIERLTRALQLAQDKANDERPDPNN